MELDINQMKETYHIEELRGLNDQINYVKFKIIFELNDQKTIHHAELRLDSSLPKHSSKEDVVFSCLNQLGSHTLDQIREFLFERLVDEIEYHSLGSEQIFVDYLEVDSVPRLYARLALIEFNMWETIKSYFENPERTEEELSFFEDSQIWKKNDRILQSAVSSLKITNDLLDQLFKKALELQLLNS